MSLVPLPWVWIRNSHVRRKEHQGVNVRCHDIDIIRTDVLGKRSATMSQPAECGATVVLQWYASLPEHRVPQGSILSGTWALLEKFSNNKLLL